jgi:hypothetical protein
VPRLARFVLLMKLPLAYIWRGRGEFSDDSPSVVLCHSRNAATGGTIAYAAETAGPPTSILTQTRQSDNHPRDDADYTNARGFGTVGRV